MELNKAACEAATGAFINRLTDKPATSDLLAALRFALEAYESVRVAPAPASQQEAGELARLDALLYGTGIYLQKPDGTQQHIPIDDVRFVQMPNVPMRSILPELFEEASRAQRTNEGESK